ncbi:MAG: TonB-dependent receptor plug domain-containing protein [Alphaproteobacteria bacterium]
MGARLARMQLRALLKQVVSRIPDIHPVGESMAALGISSTTDLTKIVPALNVNYANPTVAQLSVRGVSQNDFADHLETPIAVYQDEGYIGTPSAVSVPAFDLERVEVLRGPQGTLFGRNATGGLIHYISASPTDHLDGYLEASYGRFNTYNVQGAISGPVAEGVRARIAFTRNKSDGPFTNIVTGKHDAGDTDNWAVRAPGSHLAVTGGQSMIRPWPLLGTLERARIS